LADLRNKRKKEEQESRIKDAEERRKNGWCIFRYDFDLRFTRTELSLGEAIRYLCKVTGRRISWWRCPVRGLSIEYKILPTTNKAHDHGETYRSLSFSDHANEIEAKKQLVVDTLLRGMGDFRGLPRPHFDQEIALIRFLLIAPPSVGAKDWMVARAKLQPRTQEVLTTHEAELRTHILGERPSSGRPHACIVRGRLEATNDRR